VHVKIASRIVSYRIVSYYLTDIRGALDAAILLRQYDPARLAEVGFLVCTFLGLKMLEKSLTFRFLGFTFYTMFFSQNYKFKLFFQVSLNQQFYQDRPMCSYCRSSISNILSAQYVIYT